MPRLRENSKIADMLAIFTPKESTIDPELKKNKNMLHPPESMAQKKCFCPRLTWSWKLSGYPKLPHDTNES